MLQQPFILRTATDVPLRCPWLPCVQLYQVVPQVLLPVLPHLSLELQVDSDTKRGAAVELLGRLFAQPGSSEILADYSDLFRDLLKRLHDQKVGALLASSPFVAGWQHGGWMCCHEGLVAERKPEPTAACVCLG